tara:strand:- start:5493 stop:5945 length:453 start_codon:yes stop_codon:yes gene_type:complete
MATSTITKKKKQVAFNKVKNFVKSRLETTPVIVDNGDKVHVGNYTCQQDDGVWQVRYKKQNMKYFTLKGSAVAYCIALINNREQDAKTILEYDTSYSRAVENAYIYGIRQKTTNNPFKKELMYIRHQDSVYRMASVRSQLTNLLRNIKLT